MAATMAAATTAVATTTEVAAIHHRMIRVLLI